MISKLSHSTKLPIVKQATVFLDGRNLLTFGVIGLNGACTERPPGRADPDWSGLEGVSQLLNSLLLY